ncbi:MAG: hypothetical protein LBR52_05845 [Prevotellaceae bacterium]|jgi:hypothetical protein|nr:hypothetical protein [Prevotellaceae bacterium]
MKKTLLSIGAALLFTVGVMAQFSVTLPWNQYDASGIAYQGWETTKLANYEPKVNDVITVHVVGTATEDMEDFLISVVDDRPDVDYWGQYSNMPSFGSVVAGEEFDFEVKVTIATLTQADISKPSLGEPLSNPKFVLVGKNSVLSTTGTDGTGSGTSIKIDFTIFDVDVFSPIEGATVFTPNNDGKKQSLPFENKLPVSTVEAGNKIRVNITGRADADATEIQVALVDGTEAAGYWMELSEWATFEGEIIAEEPFNLTTTLDVISAPIGEGASSMQLIFTALSEANPLQIIDFEISTADVTSVSTVASSSVNVYSIEGGLAVEGAENAVVYGIDGSVVATATGKIALPKGIYLVKANNEVVKAIVK